MEPWQRKRQRQKYETLGSDKINCFNGRLSERVTFSCAIKQPVFLPCGVLVVGWLNPLAPPEAGLLV